MVPASSGEGPAPSPQEVPNEGRGAGGLTWRAGALVGRCFCGGVAAVERRAACPSTGSRFLVRSLRADAADEEQQEYLRALVRRLQLLQDLHHPCLARILDYQYAEGHLHVQVEMPTWGSLDHFVVEFGAAEAFVLRRMAVGVLQGLHFLHTRDPPIAHRDLKGSHVLLCLELNTKLTGYAWTQVDGRGMTVATVSSLPWTAPEVVRGEANDALAADVWSLGCVVLQMATAEKPWGDGEILDGVRSALLSGARPLVPNTLPAGAQDLVQSCLQYEPACRTNTSALLKHVFLAV